MFALRVRSRLRSLMRGYSWSERNDGFRAVRELKNTLASVRVLGNNDGVNWFFGASAASAELVVRQFVFDRYGGGVLNRALYRSWGDHKPIALAMPATWQAHVAVSGWCVNRFASTIAWQYIVITRLVHGSVFALRLIARLWRGDEASTSKSCPTSHVVFESLSARNLPAGKAGQRSFDICSFYAQWSGRDKSIRAICHNIPETQERLAGDLPVLYRAPVHELAVGWTNAARLAVWSIGAFAFSAIQCLFGRWEYALLLAEAVKARSVRLCDPDLLAQEYLFHSSGTIYRPMWTYEAQRRGAGVSLYFYSTYDQPKLARGYESQHFEWGPANWPRYIVWDAYQESILKRDLGDDIQVAYSGAVYFSDSPQPVLPLPHRSIAVFDIQPHRPAAHFGMSTLADCLAAHHDFYHRFLEDIAAAIQACGANMVLKSKRDIEGRGNKRYKRIVDTLAQRKDVKVIPSDVSAMRLVSGCRAGISVPFTSTAIYLRDMGVPCIYYDPYGWMQLDDSGARGISIIQGKSDLIKWLERMFDADADLIEQ